MTIDVRTLLTVISDHPVLPPAGSLPPDREELRAVLGEIAQGSRSAHASLIGEVGAARRVDFDEIVRRARFLLACIMLPSNGTYYELLGVSPRASSREIRHRWATLIQRYHPDHAGPERGLGDQARRLIEAYQILRDPARRRRYDAELSRARGEWRVVTPVEAPGSWRRLAPTGRWRWAPAAIVALGVIVVVGFVRWTTQPAPSTSRPALRPAPHATSEVIPTDPWPVTPPRAQRQADIGVATEAEGPATRSRASPAPLPSLLSRIAGLESSTAHPTSDTGSGVQARREEEHWEQQAASNVANLPPPPRAASDLPSPPVAGPDGARGAERSGRDVAAPFATPGSKPTVSVAGTPAVSATERAPQPKPVPAPASQAVAAVPSGTEQKKPLPEGWSSVIEAFRGAYERKDVGALTRLFADDVRERNTVGRSAVQHLYAKNFQVLDRIRYEVSQVTAQPGSSVGEIFVQGRFRIRAVDAGNASWPLEISGPIRWTLRREGEALRIVGIDYETGRR